MLRMQHLRRRVYDEYVPAILNERDVRIRLYLRFQRQVEAEAKLLLLSQLESVIESQKNRISDFSLIDDFMHAITEKGFNTWGPIPANYVISPSSECRQIQDWTY